MYRDNLEIKSNKLPHASTSVLNGDIIHKVLHYFFLDDISPGFGEFWEIIMFLNYLQKIHPPTTILISLTRQRGLSKYK